MRRGYRARRRPTLPSPGGRAPVRDAGRVDRTPRAAPRRTAARLPVLPAAPLGSPAAERGVEAEQVRDPQRQHSNPRPPAMTATIRAGPCAGVMSPKRWSAPRCRRSRAPSRNRVPAPPLTQRVEEQSEAEHDQPHPDHEDQQHRRRGVASQDFLLVDGRHLPERSPAPERPGEADEERRRASPRGRGARQHHGLEDVPSTRPMSRMPAVASMSRPPPIRSCVDASVCPAHVLSRGPAATASPSQPHPCRRRALLRRFPGLIPAA